MARAHGPTLADTTPGVGNRLEISGRQWTVTDHSTYGNAEGYHVDEWECEPTGKPSETAYVLRERGADTRWYFTRPIPIAAVSLRGGALFANVAGSFTEPPATLVYREIAHGLDETTEGRYAEDPGESEQKTTWDYWDAKKEMNLAVERWADGRVCCYHGRRVEPRSIAVAGVAIAPTAWRVTTSTPLGPGASAVVFTFFVLIFFTSIENALTGTLGIAALVAFLKSVRGSSRLAGGWLCGSLVLGVLFSRFPPLTTVAGPLALVVVPAVLTRWAGTTPTGTGASPTVAAVVGVAAATLMAGLYSYYCFAPAPRSVEAYLLAVGPAPLAAIVAGLVAWIAGRTAAAP